MPKPSLGQKLSGKPSRSYLGSGAFSETGSVASYRSGLDSFTSNDVFGSKRKAAAADGTPPGSPLLSTPQATPLKSSLRSKPRGSAASDAGMVYGASPTRSSPSIASRLFGARMGSSSEAGGNRKSVAFSESDPWDSQPVPYNPTSYANGSSSGRIGSLSLQNVTQHAAYSSPVRRRTPSIMSDGAGSVISDTGSISRKRGSRSDVIVSSMLGTSPKPVSPLATSPSSDRWHRTLGGKGDSFTPGPPASSRSNYSSRSPSKLNQVTDIIPRKSSMRKSPFDLGDPQPSRRYSIQPPAAVAASVPEAPIPNQASSTAPAPNGTPLLSVPEADDDAISTSSAKSSTSGGQSAGKRKKPKAASLTSADDPPQIAKHTANGTERPQGSGTVIEENMFGKDTRTSSTTAMPSTAQTLHSETLRNTLLAATPVTRPQIVRNKSAEQIVEALAKAGLLERVMEVVQEADEEGDTSLDSRRSSMAGLPRRSSDDTIQAPSRTYMQQPTFMVTSPTVPDLSTDVHQTQNHDVHAATNEAESVLPYGMTYTQPKGANTVPAAYTVVDKVSGEQGTAVVNEPQWGVEDAKEALHMASEPVVKAATAAEQPKQIDQSPAKELHGMHGAGKDGIDQQMPSASSPVISAASRKSVDSVYSTNSIGQEADGEGKPQVDVPTVAPILNAKNESSSSSTAPLETSYADGETPQIASSKPHDLVSESPSSPTSETPRPTSPKSPPRPTAPTREVLSLIAAGSLPLPIPGLSPLRLESLSLASTTSPTFFSRSLAGTILAHGTATQSTVSVRLTSNDWQSHEEIPALSQPLSAGDAADFHRYSFVWPIPPGSRFTAVSLALRLDDGSGGSYWDNNDGKNYSAKIPALRRTSSVRTASTASFVSVMQTPLSSPPLGFSRDASTVEHAHDTQNANIARMLPRTTDSARFPAASPPSSKDRVSQITVDHSQANQQHGATLGEPIALAGEQIPDTLETLERSSADTNPTSQRTAVASIGNAEPAPSAELVSERHSHLPHGERNDETQGLHQAATPEGHVLGQTSVDGPSTKSAATESAKLPNGHTDIVDSNHHGTPPLLTSRNADPDTIRNGNEKMSGTQGLPMNMKVGVPVTGTEITSSIPAPRSNSVMRSLSLASPVPQTLNKSFWRNNTNTKLRQNPQAQPAPALKGFSSPGSITFNSMTPVPYRIRGDEVLVNVYASAIDFWDRTKVDVLRGRSSGYGFIPGRAFVGRVVDTGSDVDPRRTRKGDFVYGVSELKTSGALADFMAVHRDNLAKAPSGALSLEQIAATALAGIPAYQCMEELCNNLVKGSKLIILNAHEGVGAIALQLAAVLRPENDLHILAHHPPDFTNGNAVLRGLGANETLSGEITSALGTLKESGYDALLDSVGGRKVYDAGKHALRNDGLFVTTVGDALSAPNASGQWKKNIKALFKRTEKSKAISYWFPQPDEHNQRLALDRLRDICERGQLRPVVKRVYKFEEGGKAFVGPNEQAVVMLHQKTG